MTRFNELGEIRRSQVVTTFGPGAIIDFRSGKQRKAAISVVACGLDTWEDVSAEYTNPTRIHEPRLQHVLRKSHFRLPPVAPQKPMWSKEERKVYLQGRRFPVWLQCPKCHRIKHVRDWKQPEFGDPALVCPQCSAKSDDQDGVFVVPVRFVMACDKGHLSEFPWDMWVQHRANCDSAKRELKLSARGGTGLASLFLSCLGCGAEHSMDRVFSRDHFKDRLRCSGRQPWLDAYENCDQTPRALQRGASNLYFANHTSALDIPPWSDGIVRELGNDWDVMVKTDPETRAIVFGALDAAHNYTGRLRMTQEAILSAIEQKLQLLSSLSSESLRQEEHLKFLSDESPSGLGHEFEIRRQPVPKQFSQYVSHLIEVRRLREVRALVGFSRIMPLGADHENLCPLARTEKDWLPAVEVRGEGIYVELDHGALKNWESDHCEYLRSVVNEIQTQCENQGKSLTDKPLSPRYLLIHSLAHAMIRQLSLDCGYSSASLRERLYVQEGDYDMAGFLIYTGSTDADGTLGGLSRQAHAERFDSLMDGALNAMVWCSNDPLCIHGQSSVSEPTNHASCHACLLASETSCEEFNQMLDRSMLVGTPDNRKSGFFASHLKL